MSLAPTVSYFTYCLRTSDHDSILEAISFIDFIEAQLSANQGTRILRESLAHLTYRVSKAAYSTIRQDRQADQDERFTKALKEIELLIAEAIPVLAIDDELMSNVHLDNFFYQKGLCLLILSRYAEAKQFMIRLIGLRKKWYGTKGCLATDPVKLIFNPCA